MVFQNRCRKFDASVARQMSRPHYTKAGSEIASMPLRLARPFQQLCAVGNDLTMLGHVSGRLALFNRLSPIDPMGKQVHFSDDALGGGERNPRLFRQLLSSLGNGSVHKHNLSWAQQERNDSLTSLLRFDAGEAGAGACRNTAGAAEGAIIRLVARDIHFKKRARGNVQFQAAAAAVNQCARGDGEAAFLLDDADGLARGAAGGPDVLDDEDTLAALELEAAAQSHLPGAVALDEDRADPGGARHLIANNDAAEGGRHDAGDGKIREQLRERAAELIGMGRMLQDERALKIRGAVASAGKLEMALADCAYLFEELQDVVALH